MKTKPNNDLILIILILLFADLAAILVSKHLFNSLNFADFQTLYIGNLLNIGIFTLTIIGLVLKYFNNKSSKNFYLFVIFLSVLSILLFLIVLFIMYSDLVGMDEYILNFPAKKLVIGAFYICKILLQFYIMALIWLSISSTDRWNVVRSIVVSVLSTIILFSFGFMYSQKRYQNFEPQTDKYETAVVLGAAVWKKVKPTPIFRARIVKAFELYDTGRVENIYVTGSNAPGELSEAEAAYDLLISLGVRKDRIVTESISRTTLEQLINLRQNFVENKNAHKFVLISDHFHIPRASEICDFLKIDHKNLASNYEVSFDKLLFYRMRESILIVLFWLYGI